jgi:hypothetical protein
MIKLHHLNGDMSFMHDFLMDQATKYNVEPEVPLWCKVIIPEKDVDNWESKLIFKFKYEGKKFSDVNVYGSNKYAELSRKAENFFWGHRINLHKIEKVEAR